MHPLVSFVQLREDGLDMTFYLTEILKEGLSDEINEAAKASLKKGKRSTQIQHCL